MAFPYLGMAPALLAVLLPTCMLQGGDTCMGCRIRRGSHVCLQQQPPPATCRPGVPLGHSGWSAAGLQGVQGGQCGVDIQHTDAQQQAAAAAAAVVNMPPGMAAATGEG